MPKINVVDMTGKPAGEIELSDGIFGIEPNKAAVHMLVKNHLANRRRGTQSTLTRAEVSGGGIKPWRQKGSGRARQGSTRSPQWTHGGVALGPKPRSYEFSVNKKVRRLAIKSVLSDKVAENKLVVIDEIKFGDIKTRSFKSFLDAVNAPKALVVIKDNDSNVVLSARNLAGVKTEMAANINVYDILKYDRLVVDKAAVAVIEEVFA